MRAPFFLLLMSLAHGFGAAQSQPMDAAAIMARVAANQDAAIAERRHFLYTQHARVSSRSGKTVRCEEVTDTRVAPTDTGYSRQLLKLDGRLLVKGRYVLYDTLPKSDGNAEAKNHIDTDSNKLSLQVDDRDFMDRDLVENMRQNLTEDKSKDGIRAGLFPLSSEAQAGYVYRLVKRETMNGRDVFHITFTPKDQSDYDWRGDAYIDTTAFEPVLVRTRLAKNVPFAVRTLLGTSVPGLGFTVVFAPQAVSANEQPVWFPVSFGTEFHLNVLFFLRREITVNAENRNFERTHVTSTILPAASN